MEYLAAGYVVTWIVLIGYGASLALRARRCKNALRETL